LCPLFNGSEIVAQALAGAEGLRELEDGERELEAALGDIIPATLFKVTDSLVNFVVHLDVALPASLDFNEIVVTSHAVDETSDEVRDGHGAEAKSLSRGNGNWANSDSDKVGSDHTSLVILTKCPVTLKGGNVSLDCLSVEGVVLGNIGDQSGFVGEDLSPLLKSNDVNLGGFAVSNVCWERFGELGKSSDSSNVVTVEKVSEGILNVGK